MKSNIFNEPIDHILEKHGLCSKRAFLTFIRKNQVLINGKLVVSREEEADIDSDVISINGKPLETGKHLYFMMNKPESFVCSTESSRSKTIYSLIPEEYKRLAEKFRLGKIHSVGRLDADSCGLLLFTTNGRFSNFISSPEGKVEKTYQVRLLNKVSKTEQEEYKKAFFEGISLPELKHGKAFTTQSAVLEFSNAGSAVRVNKGDSNRGSAGIENSRGSNEWSASTEATDCTSDCTVDCTTNCTVTLSEGKFRQIRRMFSALGNEVVLLKRIKCDPLALPEDLKEGECRTFDRAIFLDI